MRTELLEAVAQLITIRSFWLRVSGIQHNQHYYVSIGGKVSQKVCRCMTLEVTHCRGHFVVGHQWQIPEPELDKAYSEIRASDADFGRRMRELRPSPKDVEMLISHATHGTIVLELSDDDDFVPTICKNKE